jgi:hypothetical protein
MKRKCPGICASIMEAETRMEVGYIKILDARVEREKEGEHRKSVQERE